MRLGTKVLLLTLALVVGLTVAVLAIVRDRVRAQELARTPAAIHRVVGEYFRRVDAAAENAQRAARLLFEDPNTRPDLKKITDDGAPAPGAELGPTAVQLRDYLLGRVMQRELALKLASGERVEPALHALFGERSDLLLISAPKDPTLAETVRRAPPAWSTGDVVEGAGHRVLQYIRAGDQLLLAIGVPVWTTLHESEGSGQPDSASGPGEPPTNAYFVCYSVDDRWASGFLGPTGDTESIALGVWFLGPSGEVIAHGGADVLGTQSFSRRLVEASRGLADGAPPRRESVDHASETFLAELTRHDASPGAPVLVAVTASLDRALEPMQALLQKITLVGVGAVIVAVITCRWIASRISRPVKGLVSATGRIAEGDFNVALSTSRRDEIGEIARGLDSMARGLAQRDFIKDTFGKFVDPSVVAGLLEDPQRLRLGGEERVQTVLMSDLEGFTALAEALRPEQVVALLNQHLGVSADIVTQLKGVVDKFIGDAVVAFWGPPLTDDHAHRAVVAALKMVDAVRALAPRCAELDVPALRLRVGVSTGEMLVGNIGSASKFNYTVMGDAVNLCSRIEGLNKHYATGVLITDASAAALPRDWTVREIDTVRVVGRATPVRVFEPLAAPDAPGDARRTAEALARAYSLALDHYCTRRFEDAAALFDECSRRFDDGAARAMNERARLFAVRPPPPDWDGAWSPGVK